MQDMYDEKLLMAIFKDDEYVYDTLCHEGVAHDEDPPGPGSGRYEWGSGENGYQRVTSYVSRVENLKKYKNLTDEDIAMLEGYPNVDQFRKRYLYEKEYAGNPSRFCSYVDALRAEKGTNGNRKYSDDEIAKMVGTKDADSLDKHYKYSKAVWDVVPENYKIDSDFHRQLDELKKQGYTPAQIALGLGVTSTALKARASIATNVFKRELIEKNRELQEGIMGEDGNWIKEPITNRSARARILGLDEGTLRSMENGNVDRNSKIIFNIADKLREEMANNKYLNIGKGTAERMSAAERMNVSEDRLKTAVEILKLEGFDTINVQVDQLGSKVGNKTTVHTLVPPGTTYQQLKEDVANIDDVIAVYHGPHSEDGGETFRPLEKPTSIDSNRVFIRYAEDGGVDKDGLIELRRNVDDISLGRAAYAQVRISVDDKYYLKGMAMAVDDKDIPPGYDIVFNTNKHEGTPMEKVFKEIDEKKAQNNPENPFGTSIKLETDEDYIFQRHYIDKKTGEEKLSAINVVNAEGDWAKWSKTVASQMLAKQKPDVVEKQLDLTYEKRLAEFNEIMSLTNPVVKKRLLDDFEKNTDSAAVNLKAVAFPGQSTRVLLPFPNMKKNEVYCPGYEDGEVVALIRYPHGGIFEIPARVVNNKYKEARNVLGDCKDAIGLHPSTSQQLSGADHDGDTVMCIPIRDKNGNKITDIKTSDDIVDIGPYKELIGFDSKAGFELPDEVIATRKAHKEDKSIPMDPRLMRDDKQKGVEMGKVTNLIADLTAKNAQPKHIVAAVKYSMVVIDSYKHNLDWKRAKKFFEIDKINKLYRETGGADTIMTRAKSPDWVYPKKEKTAVSRMTPEELERWYAGEKIYEDVTETKAYRDKETGELHMYEAHGKRVKSTKMGEATTEQDVLDLRSKNPTKVENLYASLAIRLKNLAKQARKESRSMQISSKETDPALKEKYKEEIKSLNEQVDRVLSNAPLERKAQAYGNRLFSNFERDNPDLDEDHYKKARAQCIERARKRIGSKQIKIDITDREWEAIQSGVISKTQLNKILDHANMDRVKKLAMPKQTTTLAEGKINSIITMANNGKSAAEIANSLGISISTVNNYVDFTEVRHSSIAKRTSFL